MASVGSIGAGHGGRVTAAVLDAPTEVPAMVGERAAVLGTALAVTVLALCVSGVAVTLYPMIVADADSALMRGIAKGYLASRSAEGTLVLISVAILMAMLTLSEQLADPSTTVTAGSDGIGILALSGYLYVDVAAQTAFIVGAALVSWLLYAS